MDRRRNDLSGKRFGYLTVEESSDDYISPQGYHYPTWKCVCDCGRTVVVRGDSLKNGHTKSCGCKKIIGAIDRKIHSDNRKGNRSRLYNIWANMLQRCNNIGHPNYDVYGGRGIKVCADWNTYRVFKMWALNNGYSNILSLDREDTNGMYCPENCRWVSLKVQQNNKRNNHMLTYNGETLDMMQWSEKTGIPYSTLRSRINILGWSSDKAITTPVRIKK